MKTLVIITARGGSKGIPGKNTRLLGGKPLLHYTIDIAREFAADEDICLSTDADYIIDCAQAAGLQVPFRRPDALAVDTAGTNDVIFHALDFYEQAGKTYGAVLLLQPTSPFRKAEHVQQALHLFNADSEMVIGVKETDANPYTVLYEEDAAGILRKVRDGAFVRRQDCPIVWQVNGAVYLMSVARLREKGNMAMLEKRKLIMDSISSLDLDTPLDWAFAEFILEKGLRE